LAQEFLQTAQSEMTEDEVQAVFDDWLTGGHDHTVREDLPFRLGHALGYKVQPALKLIEEESLIAQE
jgi:hypothetical protein